MIKYQLTDFNKLAKENLLICGKTGTHKSRLAHKIAKTAFCQEGRKTYVFSDDLVTYSDQDSSWLTVYPLSKNLKDAPLILSRDIVIYDELSSYFNLDQLNNLSLLVEELKARRITLISISQHWQEYESIAAAGFENVLVANLSIGKKIFDFEGQSFGYDHTSNGFFIRLWNSFQELVR